MARITVAWLVRYFKGTECGGFAVVTAPSAGAPTTSHMPVAARE